jgi:hypothetical protein
VWEAEVHLENHAALKGAKSTHLSSFTLIYTIRKNKKKHTVEELWIFHGLGGTWMDGFFCSGFSPMGVVNCRDNKESNIATAVNICTVSHHKNMEHEKSVGFDGELFALSQSSGFIVPYFVICGGERPNRVKS